MGVFFALCCDMSLQKGFVLQGGELSLLKSSDQKVGGYSTENCIPN